MVAPPKPRRIRLDRAVEEYLTVVSNQVTMNDLSSKTRDNYAADLADFVRHIGADVVVDDITGDDVDQALLAFGNTPDQRFKDPSTKKGPGRGPTTQRRYHQSVSKFFSYATTNAWVQASPLQWSSLRPKRQRRANLRTARTSLTGLQALALLTYGAGARPSGEEALKKVRAHERNWERDKFILALMLLVGPRVSEVCAANIDDFAEDEEATTWRIHGKGNKPRTVPLSDELDRYRREYLAIRPQPPAKETSRAMLLTGRGTRLTPRDVQRLLARAEGRVHAADPKGAREVTPHALRHTSATLMLAKGWDVKLVALMLGHESIATTSAYLDEMPGELAVAVADMSKAHLLR